MKISDISIKNPVFAWMLMAALMIFGGIGFSRMGVSLMPDVDFPVLSISVGWEGASPEIVETEVVDVIEDAMTSIQGIREISSSSRHGSGSISLEFDIERNIDVALQEVQTKLAQVQRRLPRDVEAPTVSKSNPEDQPIMWLALSGTRPVPELMDYAENHLRPRFQSVSGVGEIFLGGFASRTLRVWLDADKMAAKEITVDDVLTAIGRQHIEVPGGTIETPLKEFNVRTLGEASTAEEFGNLLITQRGGQPVHIPIAIKEVARVEDGLADIRRISRVMGERAVGLGIRKQRGANSVEVSRQIKERLAESQGNLPEGMKLGVNFDATKFIDEAVREIIFNLILSAILTSLVCWAFLGSWSSTMNVLIAIPTSILGTFIVTYFLGFTLNTFTLLGLTLAIGIVVDDAIMVLENIVRHREKGESRVESASRGANEIGFAALAATISILAIFIPVVFMKGIMGKFFYQFGVTMSAAVVISLLEALTLTPMRCSQFLQAGERASRFTRKTEQLFKSWASSYRGALVWALDRRWRVLGGTAGFFAASLLLAGLLRKEFVPPQDQSMFMARIQTPVGSSLEFTDAKFRLAEEWLLKQPAMNRYFGAVGGFGGGEVNTGLLFVTLKSPRERPKNEKGKRPTQQELMAEARKAMNSVPGLRAMIQDPSQQGFAASRGFPVEFTVRGPDWDRLVELSEVLGQKLKNSGEVTDVDTDYKTGMPEIRVLPDRQRAFARGVSMQTIGSTINALIGGLRAGYFTSHGRRYEIRLRTESKDREKPADIGKFFVRNNRGELIRLSDAVAIEEKPTLLAIKRKDRERAIGISANLAQGKSQAKVLAAVEKIAKETLPEDYHIVFSGSAQTFRESFQSLIFALWFGIMVAYMVLGSQFNSFVHPATVLLALPFSVSGAFIALKAADLSLNVYSMIGIILLMGIVKKNSILLVDFTNQRRREGLGVREALLDACPVRLRPILMTSFSTIAAAIPPALALGPGAETRIPMAVAVIGGVFVSTLLTLFAVPCAYSLLARWERSSAVADDEPAEKVEA
ncbi:MAG: efflux RND transporter permease subunit [Elusimicrobia bacterium]|nr:efflux RND transporter permease subunit [Elusimicrobiota bacterium]